MRKEEVPQRFKRSRLEEKLSEGMKTFKTPEGSIRGKAQGKPQPKTMEDPKKSQRLPGESDERFTLAPDGQTATILEA